MDKVIMAHVNAGILNVIAERVYALEKQIADIKIPDDSSVWTIKKEKRQTLRSCSGDLIELMERLGCNIAFKNAEYNGETLCCIRYITIPEDFSYESLMNAIITKICEFEYTIDNLSIPMRIAQAPALNERISNLRYIREQLIATTV